MSTALFLSGRVGAVAAGGSSSIVPTNAIRNRSGGYVLNRTGGYVLKRAA